MPFRTYHASHDPGPLWIACVAVVFAVYGYVIQQRRIAQEAYGDFDKVTMDSGLAVLKPLEVSGRTTTASAILCRFQF